MGGEGGFTVCHSGVDYNGYCIPVTAGAYRFVVSFCMLARLGCLASRDEKREKGQLKHEAGRSILTKKKRVLSFMCFGCQTSFSHSQFLYVQFSAFLPPPSLLAPPRY
jgi:hypothetical protein